MRDLGKVSAVLGTLATASAALAFFAAGCGGDDTTIQPDAADATKDTTADHTMADSRQPDVKHKDSAPPEDVQDSGKDSASDVKGFDVGDAGFDVGDVDLSDAAFDVSIAQYPAAVNLAWCQHLESCCAAIDGGVADAGSFVASCLSALGPYSVAGNLNLANTASPNVTYGPAKAKACLDQLTAIPCGTVTAAQSELNYLTCASAIQGKLAIGKSPCTSSFDCVSGAYCPTDGGTCTALSTAGNPCTDTVYSQDCTYLGNGEPLLYCDSDSGTCLSDFPNGSTCGEYEQCQSQVCVYSASSGTCATSLQFASPSFCASF